MNRLLLPLLLAGLPLAICPAKPPPSPAPLDALLGGELWQTPDTTLESGFKPLGFEWTSAAKETARSVHPGLQFQGRKVYEALISFRGGKPQQVILIYFNRGDGGELRRDQFEKLVADGTSDLGKLTGKTAVERGRDPSSAVKAQGLIWETPASKYLLEWSATKESKVKMIPFRAEFVRLTIVPSHAQPAPLGAAVPSTTRHLVQSFKGKDHVQRTSSGDIKIDGIPMVDQGSKGYCVVASVERIMRYYGAPVDQHELAQIANSDAGKGTSVNAMLDSLKQLTARLGVRVRVLSDNVDYSEFLKTVDEYNRTAKRAKLPPVVVGSGMIESDKILQQMNPEVFKEVRMKKKADFGKFQREIQRSVDEGTPLLWSVTLGMVKEKEIPTAFGGHMRLIIGYNPQTQEILYSDSWGRGHEEKRMSMDDAWTITDGLNSLEPLGT